MAAAYIADARKDPNIAAALDDDMFFLHNYPHKDNAKALYAKWVQLPPQKLDRGIRQMFMRTQQLLPPQLRPQMPVPRGTVIKVSSAGVNAVSEFGSSASADMQ